MRTLRLKKGFYALLLGLSTLVLFHSNNHQDTAKVRLWKDANAQMNSPTDDPSAAIVTVQRQRIFSPMCHQLLLAENNATVNAAKNMPSDDIFSDAMYVKLTKTCSTFIKLRGYIMQPLSEEESDFPIAYSILMYKDVSQTERLLRAIYCPQNYYIIHVDPRAKTVVKDAVNGLVSCFPNVYEAQNPVAINWANNSLLNAELNCMRQLLEHKKWKYLINLTGQEFPLWSNRYIVRTLKAFKGANNIEGSRKWVRPSRFNMHFENNVPTNRTKAPPPHNLNIVKGSVHILGSRPFVQFALKDERALSLLQWLNDTYIADEHFFGTLNYNPKLKAPGGFLGPPESDSIRNPFLARYVKWQFGSPVFGPDYRLPACRGKFVRQVCVHGVGSLHQLYKRPELFVNKFHMDYEPMALDCLEQLQWNRTVSSASRSYTFDDESISRLSFVVNQTRIQPTQGSA